jgi:peptidoglycan/xylan/chitin deacetylase (PgdA/CDA1 family)
MEARRRTRLRRTLAGAAVAAVLLVGGAAFGIAGARGAFRPSTPAVGVSRLATESVMPTTAVSLAKVAGAKAVEPTGAPGAVGEYALKYPGAGAVAPVVIRSLKPKRKLIAITLDDGIPFDTRMLTLFEQNNVRCTTFVLGTFARSRPDLMKRLRKDGFEIANHTWDHSTLTKLSESGIRSQLSRTQAQISKTTGNQAPYMRPPGGAYNKTVTRIAGSMGFRVVMWNRSLADTSKSATVTQLYKNAVKGAKSGDIILCHWGRPHTYEAMKLIIPELKKQGFEIVTLSEMIADSGGPQALR